MYILLQNNMLSCTGWIFLSECSTNSVQRFTGVCSAKLHSTWWNAASRPLTLPISSICGLPAATSCSYHLLPCIHLSSTATLATHDPTAATEKLEHSDIKILISCQIWPLVMLRGWANLLSMQPHNERQMPGHKFWFVYRRSSNRPNLSKIIRTATKESAADSRKLNSGARPHSMALVAQWVSVS